MVQLGHLKMLIWNAQSRSHTHIRVLDDHSDNQVQQSRKHTHERKKTSSSWVERERLPVVLCINNKTHTSHGFDPLNLIAGCMTLNGVLSA